MEEIKRLELMPGVFITNVKATKFKRSRISIDFIMPDKKETATARALLPMVMEIGYKDCPDMIELSKKLDLLYGAQLQVNANKRGPNRGLTFGISGIKDDYAFNGEKLSAEYSDILFGTVFNPDVENGAFKEENVKREKENLRKKISREIDEKRSYCVNKACRLFFGDEPSGIRARGYMEDIDCITGESLYKTYLDVISSARIEVMVLGADFDKVKEELLKRLENVNRNYIEINPPKIMPKQEIIRQNEYTTAVQGKTCMMYTSNEQLEETDQEALRVALGIFGQMPTSRLFLNVREKESLCYYCSAGGNRRMGYISVDSGVEHENADRLINSVNRELKDICENGVTDEELLASKRSIVDLMDSIADGIERLEAWYLTEIFAGRLRTPSDAKVEIEKVTKEDVVRVLSKFTLSVVYVLTDKKEEVND